MVILSLIHIQEQESQADILVPCRIPFLKMGSCEVPKHWPVMPVVNKTPWFSTLVVLVKILVFIINIGPLYTRDKPQLSLLAKTSYITHGDTILRAACVGTRWLKSVIINHICLFRGLMCFLF